MGFKPKIYDVVRSLNYDWKLDVMKVSETWLLKSCDEIRNFSQMMKNDRWLVHSFKESSFSNLPDLLLFSSVNNVFIGFIFVGQTRQFQNVKLGSGKLWTGIFHHFKNENGCQLPQPPQENPISMQAHTQKPNRWPIQRPRGEKTKFVSWWNQKAKA